LLSGEAGSSFPEEICGTWIFPANTELTAAIYNTVMVAVQHENPANINAKSSPVQISA
jgi:hypothetical protein